MLGHRNSNPAIVLQRIVGELIENVPGLDEGTCYITRDEDDLGPQPESEMIATVFPLSPIHPIASEFTGAGQFRLSVEMDVVVKLWRHWALADAHGRATNLLIDESSGMFSLCRRIGSVLVNNPLRDVESSQHLLSEGLIPGPAAWGETNDQESGGGEWISWTFSAKFVWDLQLDDTGADPSSSLGLVPEL